VPRRPDLIQRKVSAVIVSIELQQLRCRAESDANGSRPYLWVELLQVDDDTLSSTAQVASVAWPPPPAGAQVVIHEGMRAGHSAPIPDLLARLGAQFRPGQRTRDLIIVAALWDRRDTPFPAVLAGYEAFLPEVREAVAASVLALAGSSGAAQDAIINTIKKSITEKVKDAIESKLSTWDKFETWVGLEKQDRSIDAAFARLELEETSSSSQFALAFGAGSTDDYEVDCALVVTVDPCESELISVSAAQLDIATTQGAIRELEGSENGRTDQELEQLRTELAAQEANLHAAEDALSICRTRNPASGAPSKEV
jgi:hypothetical protein